LVPLVWLGRVDSMDSQDFDPEGTRAPGGFLRQNSLSATLREWDIPFIELDVGSYMYLGFLNDL